MRYRIDRTSPIPLYHQLAEAMRWEISTGRLKLGERLTPVRKAADDLGVNLHTVRRAYSELLRDGLVESRGSQGTWVLGGGAGTQRNSPSAADLEGFLESVLAHAQERFDLEPEALCSQLAARRAISIPPVVHILECNLPQCLDHAEEIRSRWSVNANPWCLDQTGEPPPGPLVATYFHYSEIVRRWPHRRNDLHFVAVHVEPALKQHLLQHSRVLACELDEARALNIKADLEALLPPGAIEITPFALTVLKDALANQPSSTPLFFAPRAYAALSSIERKNPQVFKVTYVIEVDALEDLGQRLKWQRVEALRSVKT